MQRRTTVFTELKKLKAETALRRVQAQFKDLAVARHFTRVSDVSQADLRLLVVVKGKWLLAWAQGPSDADGLNFDDELNNTSFRLAPEGDRVRFISDDPHMRVRLDDPNVLLGWWGKERGALLVEALRAGSVAEQLERICNILELPAEDAELTYEDAVTRYAESGLHLGWKRKERLPQGARLPILRPVVRMVLGKGRVTLPGHRELTVQLFSEGGTATGLGCRVRKRGRVTPVRLTLAESQVRALNALFEPDEDGDWVATLAGIHLPRGTARSWPDDYEGVLLVKDDGLPSYELVVEVWPLEAPDAVTTAELKFE